MPLPNYVISDDQLADVKLSAEYKTAMYLKEWWNRRLTNNYIDDIRKRYDNVMRELDLLDDWNDEAIERAISVRAIELWMERDKLLRTAIVIEDLREV